MQTLISVFSDRGAARRAMERLEQSGFAREDMHLQEPEGGAPAAATVVSERATERELGERAMDSSEREIAVDRTTLEAMGHFFVSLFGRDRGEGHAQRYRTAVGRGQCVLVVDARDDRQAESAAMVLHDAGAIDVDDHDEGRTQHAGVRAYRRDEQPALRDLAAQRNVREESLLADRAGQVTRDRLEREDRAYAASDAELTRDRPI
jgi:hypothetical protein